MLIIVKQKTLGDDYDIEKRSCLQVCMKRSTVRTPQKFVRQKECLLPTLSRLTREIHIDFPFKDAVKSK